MFLLLLSVAKFDYQRLRPSHKFAVPSDYFFRMLSKLGWTPDAQGNILEIGFGYGANLLEFERRKSFYNWGGSCYGIDINEHNVLNIANSEINTICSDVLIAGISFPVQFDLIYGLDIYYYFTLNEIKQHFKEVYDKLTLDGLFVFNFIEKRVKITSTLEEIPDLTFEELPFNFGENPINRIPIKELTQIITNCKFTILQTSFNLTVIPQTLDEYYLKRYVALKRRDT